MSFKRTIYYILCGVAGLVVAVAGVTTGRLPVLGSGFDGHGLPLEGTYQPAATMQSGRELAMVYVGSSTCRWSNEEHLPGVVHQAKWVLSQRAAESGRTFAAVGIARDRGIDAGLEHLQKYGTFDEIMVGRGWLNIGLLKYVYQDIPGPAATPQLIVLDREVVREPGISTYVRNERVVLRKVGSRDIQEWAETLDMALPQLQPLSGDSVGTE